MFEKLLDLLVLDAVSGKVRAGWYVWAGGSLVCLWFFFWWSIGMMPTVVFGEGFAKAEDLKTLRVQILEKTIIDYRVAQCGAPSLTGRAFYASLVQEKMREYVEQMKQPFVLPECTDLVVPNQPPQ